MSKATTGWRLRVRLKFFRSGTTYCKFGIGIVSPSPMKGTTVGNGENDLSRVFVDGQKLAADTWHDLEFFFAPVPSDMTKEWKIGILSMANTNSGYWLVSQLTCDELFQTGVGIPQKVKTSSYTLEIDDQGKHIYISTGGVTIPLLSAVNFPIDTTINIINSSNATQSIGKSAGVTLIRAGGGSVSSVTLAVYGVATLLKTASDTWYVSGNVT